MRKGCSAASIAGTQSPSTASSRLARCAAASPGRRKPGGLSPGHWRTSGLTGNVAGSLGRDPAAPESPLPRVKAASLAGGRSRPLAWCSRPRKRATSPARPLEPKQPLHLVPHGDAQVDAERKQGKRDQPEANVRRPALARTLLAVLSLRSLAPIFATDGAGVVDRYVRRRLSCGLSHRREFSGLTGNVRLLPGPRSRCARVRARPCQGCRPCLRTIVATGLMLATQEAGNITGQATSGLTGNVRRRAAILRAGGR